MIDSFPKGVNMLPKEEFLKRIKKRILPLIDLENEKRVRRTCKIVALCVYLIVLGLLIALFVSQPPQKPKEYLDVLKAIFIMPFVVAAAIGVAIWDYYIRRNKKKLRPTVLSILNAIYIPEKKLPGLTINQLRKIHFLPRFDSRDKDEVQNDSFGIMDESLPFYIQEVSFSEGGKHPKIFQGPVIRFFLPQKSDFILMVVRKNSLLYKDKLALSTKQSLNSLLESENWRPLTLESPRFNKNYFAFTNDQIKARSILTPRFMEHIQDVEKVYKAPTNFLFHKDQLILAVKTNKNMFEFFKGGKKISSYEKFYDEIEVLHQFKDIFKLK